MSSRCPHASARPWEISVREWEGAVTDRGLVPVQPEDARRRAEPGRLAEFRRVPLVGYRHSPRAAGRGRDDHPARARPGQAQQKLARLFETQAHYAAVVLRACARPGGMDAHAQRLSAGPAGRAARQARSDAEASADRLADEPSRPPITARLAYGLTGIGRRIAHASLTLQAAVEAAHTGQKAPGGKKTGVSPPARRPVTAQRPPVTAQRRIRVTRRAPARHRTTRTRCSSVPPTSSPTHWTPLPTCSAAA